jgi:MFS family permease
MTAAQRSSRSGGRLSPRAAAWIAWSLWSVAVVMAVSTMILVVVTRSVPRSAYDQWQLVWLRMLGQLAFPTVGLIIASRRSTNLLEWLLLFFGLSLSANEFLRAYAEYTLLYRPGALPGGLAIAWVSTWIWGFIYPILPFVLLLFPDGRLPSPNWRPFACIAGLLSGLFLLMIPFRAGGLEYFPTIPNPVGIPVLTEAAFQSLAFANFIVILVAATSLPVRFRRARGEERQQLKWVAYAAVFLGVVGVVAPVWLPPWLSVIVSTVAFTGFAAAIAVAILKYRLYDIDRIINRTLVYGTLTALLGSVYAGAVLILGQVFGGVGGDPPGWVVAGATLAVAALFQPARRRIQQAVDRRFNRARYDAAETVEAFAARLRNELDLDTLSAELLAVVDQTMQPTTASLWLKPSPQARPGGIGRGS